MDTEQLVLGGLALLVAGWLGFRGNPIRTCKISAILLPLLYAYFLYQGCRYYNECLLFIPGGVCSVMASAEIIIASYKRRDVKWTQVRATLTICSILTFAPLALMIDERLISSVGYAAYIIAFSSIIVGPSACLAAALWKGLPKKIGSDSTD